MVGGTRTRALLASVAGLAVAVGGALGAESAAAAPGDGRTRFIVTVADSADARAVASDHQRTGAQVDFVYTAALNGFAGAMSDSDLAALQRDRRVVRIERDGVVTANETTQANATWGLDRVDARSGLDGLYGYTATGTAVATYIVDTGIHLNHSDFGGRALSGYDAIDGGTADDCDGHGTHVAGTVGGTLHGVAKAVTLHAVRVLDCNGSGTWSGVIAGLDWVAAHHAQGAAVANMSLGGAANSSVDEAVQRVVDDGVTVVVAAGNGDRLGRAQDACNYSPARVAAAVTIGATTQSDAKTSWSNYGSCVDLFAPGASITSTWHTSDTATNTISGTSMAAPHVTGVAALYLETHPGASALEVRDAIYAASTKRVVTSSSTANNHLLHSRLGSGDGGTGGEPQPSAITLSARGYKKGTLKVELAWSGAASGDVDVHRNGTRIVTTPNDGAHTDNVGKTGGTYTYRVCEAGTTTCSTEVTVTF